MAGRTATLTVQVLADTAKAQAAMRGVGSSAQGMGSKLGGMVPSVASAGIAVAGFAVAAGAAAMAAAEDAAEHERLLQAYEAAGAATGDYTAEIDKAIERGQELAFTDTEIRDALVPLIAASGDAEQASKDLALAQDLARLKGVDLETAARAVGKAQEGSATALAKMVGVSAKGKTAAEVLAEAQGLAAGQAEVYGETTAGQAEAMKIGFSELTEQVGTAFIPIMEAIIPVLQNVSKWISNNIGVVKVIVGVIGALLAVVLATSVALKVYNTIQTIMAAKTGIMTAAQWLLNAALAANPIGIIVLAIAALVAGLVLAYNKSETFRKIVDRAFKFVADTVKSVVRFITNAWDDLTAILMAPFEALMDFIGGVGDAVGGFIDMLPGGKSAAPAPAPAMGRAGPTPYATTPTGSVPGSSGLGLKVSGKVTVTHKIDDPHGALSSIPGGAAAVARELARASDATGLYRNLQHAAGLR